MLKALFEWLDSHPGVYWVLAGVVTAFLARRVAVAFRTNRPGPATCSWRSRAWDALALFLFVLGWRWPFLLAANEYSPDESQLIAGAITLAHDPVFWRSVDGTTSGPLNFYVLLPLHWLGMPLDYFTARLAALAMIGVSLFASHRALARVFGATLAWLAVLPTAGFFATVTHPDLIHFSSEYVSLTLVAGAISLLAGRQPAERWRLWLACGMAGAAPWAKLQATPIALALIGWALFQAMTESGAPRTVRWRRAGSAIFAAALPTLVAAILIVATGQFETALRRYIFQNVFYVNDARPLAAALREMARLAVVDGRAPWLLAIALVFLVTSGLYYAIRRVRPPHLFIAGGAITLATILAILTPRREYLHYVLLLPVPLTVWVGAGLGGWWTALSTARARTFFFWTVLLAGSLPLWVTRCRQPRPEMVGQLQQHWRHPRTGAALLIRELAGPEDSLAIWGWTNHLYVETGLRQATRDSHSTWSILPNAQRDYQRADYLESIRRLQPAVFVDAVGVRAFAFENRATQAHEIFPELSAYLDRHYTLVADLGSARIYGRNGLPTLSRFTPERIEELLARGRVSHHLSLPPPVGANSLENRPRKYVADREVLMIEPPAEIAWALAPDVREFTIEFGFDPVAYERGHSNGAEIIAELVDAQSTREVFRRLLDPAKRTPDRNLQRAVVTLPAFDPGTRLVIRSSPGENNDGAWDWLYLASLNFRHEPGFLPAQFPGFAPVPDFAQAATARLYYDGARGKITLHAPIMVGYVLNGREQGLQFDYGFADGAYTNGGNTDGAVFRVERDRPGHPSTVLFERFLQPRDIAADRGVQRAKVSLTGIAPGDRLLIRIDPGPADNGSWDWTYLDKVKLLGR